MEIMTDSLLIKLTDGQNGYDAVGNYIRNYWKHNCFLDTVVVYFETSYNGKDFSSEYDVACPYNGCDIEFFNDWWEGQKYIRLRGIKYIRELDVGGGIYTE